MTIDEMLAQLDLWAAEIGSYKADADYVLEGAANLQTFNQAGVSTSTLQLEIQVYTDVVRKAGTALSSIATLKTSLTALGSIHYPDLPLVPGTPEAQEDLLLDSAKMEKAITQIQVPGATQVVHEELSEEQPIGGEP